MACTKTSFGAGKTWEMRDCQPEAKHAFFNKEVDTFIKTSLIRTFQSQASALHQNQVWCMHQSWFWCKADALAACVLFDDRSSSCV